MDIIRSEEMFFKFRDKLKHNQLKQTNKHKRVQQMMCMRQTEHLLKLTVYFYDGS